MKAIFLRAPLEEIYLFRGKSEDNGLSDICRGLFWLSFIFFEKGEGNGLPALRSYVVRKKLG